MEANLEFRRMAPENQRVTAFRRIAKYGADGPVQQPTGLAHHIRARDDPKRLLSAHGESAL
jgi:hypothetical protein